MFEKLKKLFRKDTTVTKTIDFGLSLSAPGAEFKMPAAAIAPSVIATSNEPVIVPAVVVPPIAPVMKPEPRVCHACGQRLPESVAAVVDPSVLAAAWNDLERADLPPRTQPQIASLIAAGETPENREKRIWNDKLRWSHYNGR
jgi:hypothetical protein